MCCQHIEEEKMCADGIWYIVSYCAILYPDKDEEVFGKQPLCLFL